jgi:hypothetical protein
MRLILIPLSLAAAVVAILTVLAMTPAAIEATGGAATSTSRP